MTAERALLIAAALAAGLIGCATDPAPGPVPASADEPPNRRARALDLVTPEPTDDPAKLDDAALAASITAMNERVNELTARAFAFMAEFDGGDLSANPTYRAMLREMKTAETRLGRLEEEQARRAKVKR